MVPRSPDLGTHGCKKLLDRLSRGIGAEVATQLADRDRHIIVNYREKVRRANDIAALIRAAGVEASTVQADLCDERAVAAMLDDIKQQFGRLNMLVLNASGGLERGADPGYAMQINRDAKIGLTRRALELMPSGGRIVFVTNDSTAIFPRIALGIRIESAITPRTDCVSRRNESVSVRYDDKTQ